MFILLIIFILPLCSPIYLPIHSHRGRRLANDHSTEKHNIVINKVDNTFAKLDKEILEINEFRISETYSVNCYEHELKIIFNIEEDNKKISTFGFLTNEYLRGNKVYNTSIGKSHICRSIRRYLYNYFFKFL